jgi:hypothetical protein
MTTLKHKSERCVVYTSLKKIPLQSYYILLQRSIRYEKSIYKKNVLEKHGLKTIHVNFFIMELSPASQNFHMYTLNFDTLPIVFTRPTNRLMLDAPKMVSNPQRHTNNSFLEKHDMVKKERTLFLGRILIHVCFPTTIFFHPALPFF